MVLRVELVVKFAAKLQKNPQPKHLPKLRIANSNLTLGI